MNWKRIASMFGLTIAVASWLLACSISGVPFIAKAEPSATVRSTRAARATFTPRPQVTETPLPEPTDEPTDEPTQEPSPQPVTIAPTKKPAVKATAKPVPPTNSPPQATAPPQPTQNPYKYSFISKTCEHSGGVHVFIVVYANYKDPGSQLAGARVIASYAPDSPAFGDTVGETNADGAFDYVMSPDGAPPYLGKVYAWVVDKNNTRISDIGGPLELNGKNEDDPTTCWIAKFYFAGGK